MKRRRRVRLLCAAFCFALIVPSGCCHLVAWGRVFASSGDKYESLPPSGPGFSTYTVIGATAGRQYVRRKVAETLLAAFAVLEEEEPGRRFIVAETGFQDGGRFVPHKTHREGLSVDILVPLIDEDGRTAELSRWPWNLWGYCYKLDKEGKVGGLAWEARPVDAPFLGKTELCPTVEWHTGASLDFDAIVDLVAVLDSQARKRGGRVRYVILAPEFAERILKRPDVRTSAALRDVFQQKRSWVRHDDHIHVEFGFPATKGPRP